MAINNVYVFSYSAQNIPPVFVLVLIKRNALEEVLSPACNKGELDTQAYKPNNSIKITVTIGKLETLTPFLDRLYLGSINIMTMLLHIWRMITKCLDTHQECTNKIYAFFKAPCPILFINSVVVFTKTN